MVRLYKEVAIETFEASSRACCGDLRDFIPQGCFVADLTV
jgi:hypothetical protein